MEKKRFRTSFAENIFRQKYAQGPGDTWDALAERVVEDVCGSRWGTAQPLMSTSDRAQLCEFIKQMKFIPGGRYLYYAGRPYKAFNNCYLLRAEEDTREEWSNLTQRAMACLMTGGGIGADYSRLRASNRPLLRTGGRASGPLPLAFAINAIGRNVMQGGSRRSAIYGSLDYRHEDIPLFLAAKDWHSIPVGTTGLTLWDVKQQDFNFPAPLDMTNISVNYDDSVASTVPGQAAGAAAISNGLKGNKVFIENVRQALKTGEPGFSFNFFGKELETLRNACTEVTSEDDSDVCNLGSVNMGAIQTIEEYRDVVDLASKFLVCGTLRADLPYEKVYQVREKNRRLGLGLMGIHEWLMRRGLKYEEGKEITKWLEVYRDQSVKSANEHCDRFYLSRPVAYRAIAPTGSIGILASTTTGVETLYAIAYKRRYLTDGTRWKYEYVVDATASALISELGVNPDSIETATDLASNPRRRLAFQAFVQQYVDMSISSTLNLPSWGSELNNEDKVEEFADLLADYAPYLRGFTCYPDGARGGQPITKVPYEEAMRHKGIIYEENDVCDITGKGGSCGV